MTNFLTCDILILRLLQGCVDLKVKLLDIGIFTDKGKNLEVNEDSILIKTNFVRGQEFGIFVVSDGIGDNSNGIIASALAVEVISYWWNYYFIEMLKSDFSMLRILDHLDTTIDKINYQLNIRKTNLITTLSLLIIVGDLYVIRNIGDSKIFLATYKFLDLIKLNFKKNKKNIYSNFLGKSRNLNIVKYVGDIGQNDIFLICTKSFYTLFSEDDIIKVIYNRQIYTMQDKVNFFKKKIKQSDCEDNISVILVERILKDKRGD